ncbi:flagellar export chaperone FliS [Acidaminobacter hydrogenoformans]|uniref:Flagellar protein FliS n=1 Tax=Acidaminobacter hydrogenoformans DSM 2784 TaxID=1120920 RepID=A0A1G5RUJ1_9FIRM|nr:flagellar export chaperone FliS [Acidaminobacter hydrogenoformans]SCZ77815.1 flagellar protein FliS [Acidaminobacter hydrogenoformans DSM 2784]
MSTYNAALRQASQAYGGAQVSTAPQKKLILMLYDGAIQNLMSAQRALEIKDLQTAHQKILKGQLIIEELMVTLNFEAGGDIAQDLYKLYEYFHWSLVQANIKKDKDQVAGVQQYLEELRESWHQL